MQRALGSLRYLFRTTNGLVLLAMGVTALVCAVWGTLSGPMAEWGVKDVAVRLLGIELLPDQRVGRLVVLYHSIAMAVVAIEVYFITGAVPMRVHLKSAINGSITVGYLVAIVFGLKFAYFGHDYLWHGVYIFGLSLVFFAGLVLAVALNPWDRTYWELAGPIESAKIKFDWERAAFFTMVVAMLGSALFGAAAGASFGNGFEAFLAEDLIRIPHKTPLQLAVIGHLHIMLALMGVAITLLVGRWLNFRGPLHALAMPLMIVGTIVLTAGVWLVVPYENIAHIIIYVGSTLVMLGALMLVIFGWTKLIREGLRRQDITRPRFLQGVRALLHDPLKFGPLWQMVFMNFTVSGVGIFMAVKLDDIIRVWPARDERITLTGHWHILSTLIASIILMYYADQVGLRGRVRQWFGWVLIAGTDTAFAAATMFSLKRLFLSELAQEGVVEGTMLAIDVGLGVTLVLLAAFLVWRVLAVVHGEKRPSGAVYGTLEEVRP